MSKIMYKTIFNKIEAMEIISETPKTVVAKDAWGKERRQAKDTSWHSFHDTWEDAKAYLVEQAEKKVESARGNLERAKGTLGQIKGMMQE